MFKENLLIVFKGPNDNVYNFVWLILRMEHWVIFSQDKSLVQSVFKG